ncbi:c-type cytochrome biogenesis protein CcmI [Yoonia maritima]|uniref:c-type cytochrome biogenesis protein CcmI n=1 Tax=Yoonia maritima TaxID=1435347 RepID=UPI0037354883
MLFWLICAILTLGVAGILAAPMMRTPSANVENPDVAVYKAQLSEIARDLERGVLPADEAERARAEVARRLLAASKAEPPAYKTNKTNPLLTYGIVALMGLMAFGVYWNLGAPGYDDLPLDARLAASKEMRANRPSQAELEAGAPVAPPVDAPQEYLDAIAKLRVIAPARPDDPEAWSRLAFHEAELRNFAAAARAQEHLIGILADAATTEDQQRLVDLQVAAANGLISPEAEKTIRQILGKDEQNIAARYYLGALYNQTDRPDFAYRLWRDIAENGDPQNFHVASARSQIEDAAFRAGIDYTLPEVRGPSAADIENAQDMSQADRDAMIGGMVAGLSERLANEGGPPSDWARLITAYGVLGDQDAARGIWVEAQEVFGANAAAMEVLRNAAEQAGILE